MEKKLEAINCEDAIVVNRPDNGLVIVTDKDTIVVKKSVVAEIIRLNGGDNSIIDEYKEAIMERDSRIKGLKADIDGMETELYKLRITVNDGDNKYVELRDEYNNRGLLIRELEDDITELKEKLAKSSTSCTPVGIAAVAKGKCVYNHISGAFICDCGTANRAHRVAELLTTGNVELETVELIFNIKGGNDVAKDDDVANG